MSSPVAAAPPSGLGGGANAADPAASPAAVPAAAPPRPVSRLSHLARAHRCPGRRAEGRVACQRGRAACAAARRRGVLRDAAPPPAVCSVVIKTHLWKPPARLSAAAHILHLCNLLRFWVLMKKYTHAPLAAPGPFTNIMCPTRIQILTQHSTFTARIVTHLRIRRRRRNTGPEALRYAHPWPSPSASSSPPSIWGAIA